MMLPSHPEGWVDPDPDMPSGHVSLDSSGVSTVPLDVAETCCNNDEESPISLR